MNKLLILIDKIGPSTETLAEYVGRNLGTNSQLVLARFSDLLFEIGDGKCNVWVDDCDIREFRLVYLRRVGHDFFSTAGTLALCLDHLGIKYFDTKFRDIGAAGDKFTALTRLSIGGISIPHTMYLWKETISEHAGEILKRLGSPVIAKEYASQRNTKIFILRDAKDFKQLKSVKMEGREAQFLFQEFIDIEKEFRLVVLGDKVAVVHTKAVRDYTGFQVVDNTSSDNFVFIDPKEISDQLKKLAVAAARSLGVEVAGVDAAIERKTDKNYILEVNRGPGFLHDPAKSPELPELAKFLAKELRSKNG